MVAQAAKATGDSNTDGGSCVDASVSEARGLERALNALLDEFTRTVESLQQQRTKTSAADGCGDTLSAEMQLMVHAAGVKKFDVELRRAVAQSTVRSQPVLAEAGRAKLDLINARKTVNGLRSELKTYSVPVSTAPVDKLKAAGKCSVELPDDKDDSMVDALKTELQKRKKLGVKLSALRKAKHERNSKLMRNKAKVSMLPKNIVSVGKALKLLSQFEEEAAADETK